MHEKRLSQLITMCKAYELMFLADGLANGEDSVPKLEDIINKFNYLLLYISSMSKCVGL